MPLQCLARISSTFAPDLSLSRIQNLLVESFSTVPTSSRVAHQLWRISYFHVWVCFRIDGEISRDPRLFMHRPLVSEPLYTVATPSHCSTSIRLAVSSSCNMSLPFPPLSENHPFCRHFSTGSFAISRQAVFSQAVFIQPYSVQPYPVCHIQSSHLETSHYLFDHISKPAICLK